MCLIFLSINQHPTYKLIVAANRDEFYNRKTASAHYWEEHPHLLAGRDLQAGGTWMGITTGGRISMITNYRDPHNINPNAPSRGQLVTDFLVSDLQPKTYLDSVAPHGHFYNGFNLLVGSVDELHYYSNYKNTIEVLTPGLHALSNHLLDTPWPKVSRGLNTFQNLLHTRTIQSDTLFDFLYDELRAPDDQLPDTGIGLERERALSAIFIKSPGYGSRCSTVMLVTHTNEVFFAERVYNLESFEYTTKQFQFHID